MVSFHFRVNDSFLRYPAHPITIPRGQVDYRELRAEGLDGGSLAVVLPHGEKLAAQIYFGKAGYGFYYQIRAYSGQSIPKYLSVGIDLLMKLLREGKKSYGYFEYLG